MRSTVLSMFKRRRTSVWMLAAAFLLLVSITLLPLDQLVQRFTAFGRPAASQPAVFTQGVDLGAAPAPDFKLHDQSGAVVSLSQLRGHPVVLTFFDSVCPHSDCSLMAEYLNWTAKDLGAQSAQVQWIALSVNPWHDTPATASTFLTAHQVAMPLHYLLGNSVELSPLWNAYHAQVIQQSNGVVLHTTGLYVLDSQGRERVYLDEGFDPKALSAYLGILLHEPAGATVQQRAPTTTQPAGAVAQSQTVSGTTIQFTATPARYGAYNLTVAVQDGQTTPLQGATVSADLVMPGMVMDPLTERLMPVTPPIPGVYQASGVLSMAGEWEVVVHVQPAGRSQPLSATFHFTSLR